MYLHHLFLDFLPLEVTTEHCDSSLFYTVGSHWTRAQSCSTPCDSMGCSPPDSTPLSMEFSRQEYWSGLLFPPPRFLLVIRVIHSGATQETRVWLLGWEDALEEGMEIHSSILAWRILMDRGVWRATVHGVTESDTTAQHSVYMPINPWPENGNYNQWPNWATDKKP